MLKTYAEPLSHELIKRKYHYKLKSGVFEDIANGYPIGEYRTAAICVSDNPFHILRKKFTRGTMHIAGRIQCEDLGTCMDWQSSMRIMRPFIRSRTAMDEPDRLILFKECLKTTLLLRGK